MGYSRASKNLIAKKMAGKKPLLQRAKDAYVANHKKKQAEIDKFGRTAIGG